MRVSAGQRLIESEEYVRARAAGAFRSNLAARDRLKSIEVLSNRELLDMLRARQSTGLLNFDIEGVPFVGELPAAANLPATVEMIPVENLQVELNSEQSENALATAVPYGTPLPEAALNFGATPTLQKLYRFGVGEPVTLGVLDEPGAVASLLNRRLRGGVNLGLENDLLNGNAYWTGMLAGATEGTAKGATYRADALCASIAAVQAQGWYIRPLQIAIHPTTRAAVFTERDADGQPVFVREMLRDENVDWIVSKFMPVDQALVGDFFEAVGLFVHGGLEVDLSRNHSDFLTRSMVEMVLEFRTFAWVRNPTALDLVTGIT